MKFVSNLPLQEAPKISHESLAKLVAEFDMLRRVRLCFQNIEGVVERIVDFEPF
jgi:hypothetical protein